VKFETKTHEDEDDPGVVPIIKPLRAMLDAIKPENASGWMFGNSIGGALDSTTSPTECVRLAKHTVDGGREASLEVIRPVYASGSRQWV
jgi:hypothetical protein